MKQWLLRRLEVESPDITPDFSLRNSVRWPIALGLVCGDEQFAAESLRDFYRDTPRRGADTVADNLVFEASLMSAHHLAAVTHMRQHSDGHYDYVRAAIVSWYYGIYSAASAMVAAADGSSQSTHNGTANAWGRQIVDNGLALEPFGCALSTLVKKDYEAELELFRGGNKYTLNDPPVDRSSALGGCISYLKGTAQRAREIREERIKSTSGFKKLNLPNFRTKKAREFRDAILAGKPTNFLHQAIRYRGKANYRDAIFLSYGQNYKEWIANLLAGLRDTLACFLAMSSHFAERRVARGAWEEFHGDVKRNGLFSGGSEALQAG
jgi:hypothetical protein